MPNHPRIKKFFLHSRARVSVLAFLTLILIGTLLLRLPAAKPGAPLDWTDALFFIIMLMFFGDILMVLGPDDALKNFAESEAEEEEEGFKAAP